MATVIEGLDTGAAREVLPELRDLLEGGYYDSHMFSELTRDIEHAPDPFRLFLATSDGQPVGAAVVEGKVHEGYDYFGFSPVHLKRFVVARIAQGTGLSSRLIDASTEYAFGELGLDVLFGESNEYAALARYGKEGALYHKDSIERTIAPKRNNPASALLYFAADITDPRQRGRRYVSSSGIHFAFGANEATHQTLVKQGFVSQAEVLAALD